MRADPVAITVETPISASYRSRAVAGMFDLPVAPIAKAEFKAELPQYADEWQIGLIVGPSGSGKSTIARHAYKQALFTSESMPWPSDGSFSTGSPNRCPSRTSLRP